MATEQILKPYEGNEKYIFISYSHKDTEAVFSIIAHMQQEGCRLWYDEGIDPGNEWDDAIAMHIKDSALLLAFISQNYLQSDNCKDELNFARDENINRILIYLDEVELPPGMKMRLGRQQAIYYCKYLAKEDFYEKLFASQEMGELKGKAHAQSAVAEKTEEKPTVKPAEKASEKTAAKKALSSTKQNSLSEVTNPAPPKKNASKPKAAAKMSEEELFAKIKKMCDEYVAEYDRTKKFKCDKPELKKHLEMPDTEPIFMGHDDTLLGSGKNGFIISRHGIYCKELMGKAIFTKYSVLAEETAFGKNSSGITYIGKVIAYLTGIHDERKDKLMELIKQIAKLYNQNK